MGFRKTTADVLSVSLPLHGLAETKGLPRKRLVRVDFIARVLARVAERGVHVPLNARHGRGLPETCHVRAIPARVELQVAHAGWCSLALHQSLAARKSRTLILDFMQRHNIHVGPPYIGRA